MGQISTRTISHEQFGGLIPTCVIENGVYAMITFTNFTSTALVENGVYAMITFTGMTSEAFI